MEDGRFDGLGACVLPGGRRGPMGGLGCGGVPALLVVSPIHSPQIRESS